MLQEAQKTNLAIDEWLDSLPASQIKRISSEGEPLGV
jgi:hypothetical protein